MRTWKRNGYEVVEVEFDGDLHEFEIVQNDEVIATITPNTIEDMEAIIKDLNNGEDVNGWEDGMGNTIYIEIKEEEKMINLTEVKERLAGNVYTIIELDNEMMELGYGSEIDALENDDDNVVFAEKIDSDWEYTTQIFYEVLKNDNDEKVVKVTSVEKF